MTLVNSRQTLSDYCLRKLGQPVIQINIDPDQISDRIDDALQFFQDYHFDGTQKVYIRHFVTQDDVDRRFVDMTQASGRGTITGNSNVVIGIGTQFTEEAAVNTSITINNETHIVTNVSNNMYLTVDQPYTSIANGTNTVLPIFINSITDTIIGVTKIYPITSTSAQVNMFDLRYQLRLHELYDFTSTSYINFVLTQQHLRTLDMLFSGDNFLRFSRHQNKVWVDFDWGNDIQVGEFLLIEAWAIVSPDAYPKIYNDRFLKALTTAYIKLQWGHNLGKYKEVKLPGGVVLRGEEIIAEAEKEVEDLQDKIQSMYEVPPMFEIG